MLKKINLRVRFLALKIAFFGVFENDNILSSKSYTVTKSGISPQRKVGSSRNLKLKLIRYFKTTTKSFVNIRAGTRAHEAETCVRTFCRARARKRVVHVRVCTDLYNL